jgi:UDP-N-acetylglucosamine 2-epimerase (non-hydrolysing)
LHKILLIFGTRPEAIKLAPVLRRLRAEPARFTARVCVTGQHRSMLDQVLEPFGIHPDHDLDVMLPGQSLLQSTARILAGLESVVVNEAPDMVLVQGDTTTTFCGALAAFYRRIPVGHVEAGLRTGNASEPFPEEMNRVLAARLAALHFAPTERAASNLTSEGVPAARIVLTGNTGIDAVQYICAALISGTLRAPDWPWLDPARKLVLVTAHRRESFGEPFEAICRALARIAARPDAQVVYPVHRNPNVQSVVERFLAGRSGVVLLDPLPYLAFVDLMRRATLLLTDSGGVQEEGPALGKPVLVMRERTERTEGVEGGNARIVGRSEEEIVAQAAALLDDPAERQLRSRVHSPYGDGRASERICAAIEAYLRSAP